MSFGYGGLSKRMVEGGWRNPMILILSVSLKTRYVLKTCYVDENHHFLAYSAKIFSAPARKQNTSVTQSLNFLRGVERVHCLFLFPLVLGKGSCHMQNLVFFV